MFGNVTVLIMLSLMGGSHFLFGKGTVVILDTAASAGLLASMYMYVLSNNRRYISHNI